MMVFMVVLEFTRQAMAELFVEAAVGRAMEFMIVGLAGYFWRALTRAMVRMVGAMVRGVRRVLGRVIRAVLAFARSRKLTGRFFGEGREGLGHRPLGWFQPLPGMAMACHG